MKKKSFAVFGLGKFGESVAIELAHAGAEVLAFDIDEEKVHEVAPFVTRAMRVDVCDVETMETLGISNMDGVIVAITGNLNASIMATIICKEAGVPYILAKTGEQIHATILKKVGADKVIVPEKESGLRVARSLISGNFREFIELSDKVRMIEISVKPEWVNKSLRQLNLRQKHKINVIGIRKDDEITLNLDPDVPIQNDCSFIVILDKHEIPNLMKK
ncbi:MAG: TrkA family potassium uptake protein [Lachnospiraceae bacterium]|nr:TrkA family potassium uptake protein [Lachnospiraceae bacterium]